MPVTTTLVTAGASVGGSIYSANKADKAARRAQSSADQRAADSLAFDQQRYEDWQSIYGPVQDNLSAYYSNLSVSSQEASSIQAIEEERSVLMDRLNTTFAQRGIAQSGLATATEVDVEVNTINQRAQARAGAPMQTAQQQSQFLQMGLGINPAGDVSRNLSGQATAGQNRANTALNISQQSANAAGDAVGGLISAVGTAHNQRNKEGVI